MSLDLDSHKVPAMQRPGVLVVQIESGKCKGPEAREHPMLLKSCNENRLSGGECFVKRRLGRGQSRCDGEPGFYAECKRRHWRFQTSNMMPFVLLKSAPGC